jgi:hypothetical protein
MSYRAEIDDMKQEINHVEQGLDKPPYLDLHHVDVKDAAAEGHVATDDKGHALVEIDPKESARLARKVRRRHAWQT